MSITIATLKCKVHIRGRSKKSPLHRDEKAAQPTQNFDMPVVMNPVAEKSEHKPAHDESGQQPNERLNAAKVDPKKVADRVYDLMKRDIQNARDRG